MASDQIVFAKLILQAQFDVQRLGLNKVVSLLENTEPDLVEFLLETSTSLHHKILHTGASGRQARRIHDAMLVMTLVCILSVQKAHLALWREGPAAGLLAQLEDPESPTPPPSPAPGS